jgi:hypothetical protein
MNHVLHVLTADMTTDARITEQPQQRTATGYGPKLPTPYMFRIANRWHRVYNANYGNSGSLYVVIKGQDYYLAGSADLVLETIRDGGSYADAQTKLTGMPSWFHESEAAAAAEGNRTDTTPEA